MGVIDQRFEKNVLITSVDYVFNWARKSSLWPLTFGLACCAIEMIASTTSRFDMARFGAEVFRPSPRQADLMIVSGTVTLKMAQVIQRVWQQMPDPKWCISMGACSSVGGPFNAYSVLQGVDRIVPVDVYVVGCPPRPEALFYALMKLQDKIDNMTLGKATDGSAAEAGDGGRVQEERDGGASARPTVKRLLSPQSLIDGNAKGKTAYGICEGGEEGGNSRGYGAGVSDRRKGRGAGECGRERFTRSIIPACTAGALWDKGSLEGQSADLPLAWMAV